MVTIDERAVLHPEFEWVYTLGECITDGDPLSLGEGDIASELVLYHGSFAALSKQDPTFDWEAEAWETILHELLHHREAAAGESGLDTLDWAEEQNFRRLAGKLFDPDFYRAVPADEDGVIRMESELFIQIPPPGRDGRAEFAWRGERYVVSVPESAGHTFVRVRNLAGGRLCVVSRARTRWLPRGGRRSAVNVERSAYPRARV